MATRDRMQDVFPVAFNFVRGEQPSSEKLTKWVKLEDSALDRVVTAIGDPWGYQSHIGSGSAVYTLSPEQLAQTSIARIAGPSDYIGPYGNALMEPMPGASLSVTLVADRNMWTIGFPLIKVKSTSRISPSSDVTTDIDSLDLDVDVTILKASDSSAHSSFNVRQTSPSDVTTSGDYCIDAIAGVIYSYDIITEDARVDFPNNNLCYLGAGAPWTTHNVIPSWADGVNGGCTVDLVSPGVYTITLPTISDTPRGTVEGINRQPIGGLGVAYTGVTVDSHAPGEGSNYRLPYSLTENLTVGNEIPTGFILLWNNSTSSIVSLTAFAYKDKYTLTVTCPTLSGSFPNTEDYRIIVTGCSLAEQVGYLSCVLRDAHFAGLTSGGQVPKTLAYLPPLSHNNLTDRFTVGSIGEFANIGGVETRYQFRESSYPTNIHSQYLHRAGYMSDDLTGNSANAMRGDIVFSSTDEYGLGADTAGCGKETFGIYFGGYQPTPLDTNNPSLRFKGGMDVGGWSFGNQANRLGFGLTTLGVTNQGSNYYGAVTYTPWRGTPLFLQGGLGTADPGAVLAFDLGRSNEMNYIKLLDGTRTATDPLNMPASTTQSATYLGINPGLYGLATKRLSPDQMREFRFRGAPYVSTATNNGLGGAATEFAKYFVSPGIVGADFINVYSNAIFFSEQGDGRQTSFTERGANWLDNNTNQPVGLYYNPDSISPAQPAKFSFVTREGVTSYTPFEVGNTYGLRSSTAYLSLSSSTTGTVTSAGEFLCGSVDGSSSTFVYGGRCFFGVHPNSSISGYTYITGGAIDAIATHGDFNITSGTGNGHGLHLVANGNATNYIRLESTGTITLTATTGVQISSTGSCWLQGTTETRIGVGTGPIIFGGTGYRQVGVLPSTAIGTNKYVIAEPTTGTLYFLSSSAKHKKDILPLKDISWIYKLNPVSFSSNTKTPNGITPDTTRYGFIAEETAMVDKNITYYDENEEPNGVVNDSIIAGLVRVVQDQKKEIDELRTIIESK